MVARLMGCGLASCAMKIHISYRLNENEKRFIQISTAVFAQYL
jgi:hypothetical protein